MGQFESFCENKSQPLLGPRAPRPHQATSSLKLRPNQTIGTTWHSRKAGEAPAVPVGHAGQPLHPGQARMPVLLPGFENALKGVSVARRNSLKPPARTTSRIADSGATAPSAGPFKAIEFAVQQSVEAPAKVRPMMLKFSSTLLPAIGSTISALWDAAPNHE